MHIVILIACVFLGVVVECLYEHLVVGPVISRWGKSPGAVARLLFIAAALATVVVRAY